MNPEDIKKQAVSRGKDAISSLRRDFTPRDFNALPPVPGQIPGAPTPIPRVSPKTPPVSFGQFVGEAFKPITQPIYKGLIEPRVIAAQRIGQVATEIKPKIQNIKRIEEKYNPFNAKSVPRVAINLLQKGKNPKAVGLAVAATASKDLQDYVSDYVSGTLTALDAPNRVIIRPAWDQAKIQIAQAKGQDVDVEGVLRGAKTLSLPDILQVDPNSLDYQAYRFLDFAPELINIPGGGTGKLKTLAKEIKVQPGLFDDIAEDAARKFTQETGETLSKEVVDRAKQIAKDAGNVKNITKAPEQTLIQEARKYKTADEFFLRMPQATRDILRSRNIKSQEAIKNWFNENASKVQVQDISKSVKPYTSEKPLTLYHVTSFENKANILNQGFKKGTELPESAFRGGGYGKIQDSISFAENPKSASMFAQNSFNTLFEVKLKPNIKIIDRKDITKAEDLNDEIPKLLEQKIDAVRIDSGEDEIVIINKNAIDKITKSVDFKATDAKNIENIIKKESKTVSKKIKPEVKLTTTQNIKIQKAEPTGLIKPTERALEGVPTADFGGAVPPSGGIPTFLPEPPKIIPTKERKFPVSVKKAESTAPGVKKILDNRLDLYSPIKNKDEFAKATKYVQETPIDEVIDTLKLTDDPRQVSYVGQALMQKLQKEGNYARVVDILDIVAQEGTKAGQAIQALSIWNKLTPEGALRYAQTQVTKYNQANKLLPGQKGYLQLTQGQIKNITDQAKKIGGDMSDDMLETAKLVNEIAKVIPATLGEKLSAFQTLAQLLNPKTFIRNIGGNLIFGSIDVLSQNFASLIDLATALFTKKRTIAPANLKKLTEGGVEGLQKGLQEALTGADTTNLKSQFDLPNASVFDSRIMQGLEKALGVVLKAPDRAFYEATYKDTLSGLMKLNKTNKPTKEMIEIAHAEGLRRTFQDDTRASKAFQMIKNAFNKAGIKGFGLGDLVLKYPKTPANLLVRATEYSPVGFLTTVYELARPLFGQPFRQREFANNLSRALVGSGIITTGANLYNLGILTPRPNSDKDLRSAQDLQGLKSYSFNISALKRFVMSGFDADAAKPAVGDTLYSYDWAQPISVPLAMGANIAENQNKVKTGSFADKLLLSFGPLGSEIIQSADTLVEQPLLTGLQRLFTSQNPTQGIVDTITSLPASFVPTLFNQINQLTDNVSRETYSPDYFQAAINQTQARIPYLATFLPERKDILGRTRYKYPDNSNTIFNVFINPGFMDTIKENESLKEVISIFEETGEKGQIPRVVQKSIKVNGEDRLLSGPEISNYQQELGQLSDNVIRSSLLSENYLKLSPTDRSKLIATMITDANKVAKIRLFGETADDISQTQELLLNGDINRYVDDRVAKKEEALIRQKFRQSGIKISGIKSPVAKKPRIRKAPKVKKARIPKIKKRKPIKISGIRLKRRKPRNI